MLQLRIHIPRLKILQATAKIKDNASHKKRKKKKKAAAAVDQLCMVKGKMIKINS